MLPPEVIVHGLTERQAEILDVYRSWLEEHGVPPSFREIGARLGIQSTNGVSDHIRALEKKGYLERVGANGSARSLRLTAKALGELEPPAKEDAVARVPVLGRVAAGQPILAEEDHDDALFVDRGLLPSKGELFALTVRGDSMIGDGILDGDYVFVRRATTAGPNDIAAVLVEGEATIKRVQRDRGELLLLPSNPDMAPIRVRADAGEVRIMGIVVGVYRRVH